MKENGSRREKGGDFPRRSVRRTSMEKNGILAPTREVRDDVPRFLRRERAQLPPRAPL